MKTIPVLIFNSVSRAWGAVTLTVAVFSAVLLGGVSVQAQTYLWIGSSDNNYTNSAAWSPAGVPGILDTAIIGNGTLANGTVLYTNILSNPLSTNKLYLLEMNTNAGTSTFTMTDGVLLITNGTAGVAGSGGSAFIMGDASNAVDTFNQSGGTLVVARPSTSLEYYQDAFLPGQATGANATYSISGGLLEILCGLEIGEDGNATFTVSGGTVIDNGWFGVRGGNTSSGSGTFDFTGGTVYLLRNTAMEGSYTGVALAQVGYNSTASISGGTLYAEAITFANNANATETLNISGGNLYLGFVGVRWVSPGAAANNINISGGTFHTLDMVLDTATTVGNTNTILSDGTNWIWSANLPVNLTNSTFLVNGTAGPGYVTFAPETNRTITLSNQWSGVGGFVVDGPGTVISENNGLQNVGGGISVSNGTLVICGTITNASSIFVSTNSALYIGTNESTPGTLTATNLTFQGPGSTLAVTVNTNTTPGGYISGLLVVTNLTLDPANSILDVIPINVPPVGSTYVVAEYSGTLAGAFSAVTNYQGYAFTVSYATPGEITVTYTGAGNYYNWISPSPADWSMANDWDVLNVPNSANAVVLLTNDVECDYSSSDNYSIGQLSIAPWDNSSGSLVMSGGSLYVSNSLDYYDVTIGGRSGTNGVGGSGESPSTPSLGLPATASLTMNNGTMTVVMPGAGYYDQDAFIVGLSTNTTGTFTINNGTLNALCGIEIGLYGNGIFNINGGSVVDNGWFGIGHGNGVAFGSGAFNMTAGALYILENGGGGTVGGNGGLCMDQGATNSMINISGGMVYSGDIAFEGSNLTPTPVDTLNMSGGTIYIGSAGIYTNSETVVPTCNISGGTFGTVDMLQSGGKGGANGAITNILSDGTNWTWKPEPAVNLTNSSFSVNGSSGPGYVTFAPEANRTITLNNQWSGVGGMAMSGPGTLVFASTNTINFSGPLTVNGGTLAIPAAQSESGPLMVNGGTLAIAAAQSDTSGLTVNGGNVVIQNGGSLLDQSIPFLSGSSLTFSNSATIAFTNVVTGGANVSVSGGAVVNVGNNLQNTGVIVQNNGILVVNGTILNAGSVTDSSPSSVGPFIAQGTITSPIGIGTNSSLELGNTTSPGTLNASNVTLNGTWIAKINTLTTPGGGTNDLLICSNLTLNPGSSVLSLVPQTPLSMGTYVLAEYVNLNGQFGALSNSTRGVVSLNYVPATESALGQLQLVVSSSSPANLTWAAHIGATDINWDVNTSSNWTNTATSALDKFYQYDAVMFNLVTNGASAITNRVSITGQVIPSSISISGGDPYIFSGAGEISGGTGINYNDTNTSGIYTGGNTYTGPVNINAGVLQLGLGGSSWLGESNTTYVNGGTLDLDGQNVGAEPLVLQGSGGGLAGTNGGAINNSSSTAPSQSGGPLNISLAGDTTFNASGNRWDIGVATLGAGGASFAGNGHNIIKIGNQAIWIHETGDIGVDNITISNGLLGFQYTVGMGNPADTVTVEPSATLGINQLQTNSLLNKQMVLNGNATLSSGGGAGSSNNFIGPITLNGTNTITTSTNTPLNLAGDIGGTGGFILSGTGPLYLGGSDSYSGSTILGAGSSLILGTGASLSGTPLIYMTPSTNTVLGTVGGGSGTGAITLSSGQTLEGAGSINASNFVAPTGSTIVLGTNTTTATYGTIVFTNNLMLNGDTNYLKISDYNNAGIDNDLIQVNQQLTLSGNSTIVVTPLAALSAGNAYTIIQFGSIIGSANNLTIVSASPRYNMAPVINGNDVQLNITGNAAPLEWKGYLTPNWDLVTSNWYNMGTANKDHFYNGDNPTFDDSSSVTSVVITNNVLVAGINMSNVVNNYTFSGGGVITGPLNMEGNGNNGGRLVLAMSNAPAFTGIDSSAGTLVFNLQGMTNYTVAASITDSNGNQAGTIIFGGTNTALLEGDLPAPYIGGSYNPDFDGTIMVTNGILEYTNVDSLGVDAIVRNNPAFSPLIITNNGTLNFNGVAAGTANGAPLGGQKWIHISGSGYNGQGALTDTAGNEEPSGAFCYLYLDGNATIGSVTGVRYDQHILSGNAQQVEGNGFNLTFTGAGYLVLYGQSDGDTHFGNIDVASAPPGRLLFQDGPIALGITTNYLFVESNAMVTFYAVTNELDPVHNGLDKIMWLKGGAAVDSGGVSNNFIGPVFLSGTNLIGTRSAMTLWGGIMDSNGPGGFILGNDSAGASGAALWLEGTNSYSGPTIVSNETLYVGANSSLGLSTYVQVNSGATLNLSAMPVFNFGTVATNQTMAGNGTVVGPPGATPAGGINFNAGSTLAIGLPATNGFANTNTFTLTINGNVLFSAGSTNLIGANKTSPGAGSVPVDEVSGMTSVTIGGTLVVTNYGTSFVAGDSLKLFNATTYATNAYTIVPATPGPNLAWNISSIPVNGTLSVLSTLIVNPNPTNIVFSVSGGNLSLSWPGDHLGWTLQSQTNSLSVGISTNWTTVSGSSSVTNVVIPINLTNGSVFYRLTY